jgi:hypothetical protein
MMQKPENKNLVAAAIRKAAFEHDITESNKYVTF